MTFGERVKNRRLELGLTQQELANEAGVSQSLIAGIERGSYSDSKHGVALARALGLDPMWLVKGEGWPTESVNPRDFKYRKVSPEEEAEVEVGRIPYWDARGSCGGGFLNYEQMPAGHLVKEATFFKRYDVRPENAIAVYADGDSMSNFIVDGDIVIFDTSKTEPRTGKIFLIEHPDGLRIKQLRRDIDGSWVLASLNQDKQRFPDERIAPDHGARLKIHGQFVYRQGG